MKQSNSHVHKEVLILFTFSVDDIVSKRGSERADWLKAFINNILSSIYILQLTFERF